jgi:hypothetical protein
MAIITLDPTTGPLDAATPLELAPRPASLEGQTLGIVANGLGDSEIMFDAIADALAEHDGVADVVKIVKAGVAVAPYPEQWDDVTSRATVAVTGFGGCGSCSTRSMRDALDFEAAGIPAVCLVHSALVPAVKAMARIAGAPDYPMIVVDYPHNPTAVWTKDEARELAEQVVDAVRARLTQ